MSESGEVQVGCVSTEAETTYKAVGPSMFLDSSVEGVSLPALVDCGVQSTIILRELLHRVAIGKHSVRKRRSSSLRSQP